MKRNCNLELRLVTPSVFYHSSDYMNARYNSMLDMSPDEKQQLTIFYNGRVATCDVTELQARSIISLARREMEDEKSKTSVGGSGSQPSSPVLISSPIHNNRQTSGSGLSMKRSLQSFLQKRKSRVQAISPYPTNSRSRTS
ncbi:protein TIFY 5A [Sesamum indicum]|uniref:Protein TIFY n=1 Tax=Sesamum indicum TaxID=4182 RepID=A0A6I9U741_SESIN|nr:protein TIFY 5A [Sesamum indicum]